MEFFLGDCVSYNAQIRPNNVAVVFKDETITYSKLNASSKKIANCLNTIGINELNRIAIYIDKSIEAIEAIFGILMAGCSYVPIDPKSPIDRVSYILNNCQIEAVLTEKNKLNKISQITKTTPNLNHILNLSNSSGKPNFPPNINYVSREDIETSTDDALQINLKEDDLAYILYTSGSTGKPKGVMLSHKNALTFIDWAIDYFEISNNDILSSHAPYHFDLSIFDIYVALKTGAQLCIVPPGISSFPVSLAKFIEKCKITVWYSVPSVLVQMALYGNLKERNFSNLKTIIYAGEVFQFPFLNQLRKILHAKEIVNLYGPTETNVITYYNLKNSPHELNENVPIGLPCPYAEIHIVDHKGNPVDYGVEGELIVCGESMMKGYWEDTEKTKKNIRKVTINRKSKDFYFTGDIVVCRDDGNILYKNRRDNMIKTRGFRVELGEIETALYKNDKIQEAAVVAIPDDESGNIIKAAIVLKENTQMTTQEVERFCAQLIPYYMIPTVIEFRDYLPKTPTGKIDRKLLI